MSSHFTALREERSQLLKSAQTVLDSAKAGSRELSSVEQTSIKSTFDRVDAIDTQIKAAEKSDDLMKRVASLVAPGPVGQPHFDGDGVKDGLAQSLRSKGSFGFDMPMSKAPLLAGSLGLPSTGTQVSDPAPGTAVVALRDLFTTVAAGGPSVRYYVMGTGSAEIVPENGLKPDAGIDVTPRDGTLVKIATTFTFSDELAEDASFLISHISREAVRSVLVRENAVAVAALNDATGTLSATGPVAAAIDVLASAIGAAETTNGLTPTRILANPIDVAEIRIAKGSGSGEYHLDPLSSSPTAVHGVQLVPTPAVPAGTMYLTSPGFGAFYTRGALRVETGFAGDDWTHNRATARVEERVLPVVIRPSLVTKITLTPTA